MLHGPDQPGNPFGPADFTGIDYPQFFGWSVLLLRDMITTENIISITCTDQFYSLVPGMGNGSSSVSKKTGLIFSEFRGGSSGMAPVAGKPAMTCCRIPE